LLLIFPLFHFIPVSLKIFLFLLLLRVIFLCSPALFPSLYFVFKLCRSLSRFHSKPIPFTLFPPFLSFLFHSLPQLPSHPQKPGSKLSLYPPHSPPLVPSLTFYPYIVNRTGIALSHFLCRLKPFTFFLSHLHFFLFLRTSL
jgi:hypothetical protein